MQQPGAGLWPERAHNDGVTAPAPELDWDPGTGLKAGHVTGPVVIRGRRAERILRGTGGRVMTVDRHAGGVRTARCEHAEHR